MRTPIPKPKVATIRAAIIEGIPHKIIARMTQVSVSFVEQVSRGDKYAELEPDPTFRERLAQAFMLEIPHDGEGA